MSATRFEVLQAIRGPVMLITLGVLMVLDYFAGISFTAHTWPFLLIVFGVLKLAERSARPTQVYTRPMMPPPPPQPDPLADPFFAAQPPYPPPPPRYTGGRPQ